jgi:RNA recognition motif-containing protein
VRLNQYLDLKRMASLFGFLSEKAEDGPSTLLAAFAPEAQQKFTKKDVPISDLERKAPKKTEAKIEAKKPKKPRKPKKVVTIEATSAMSALHDSTELEVFVGNVPLVTKKAAIESLFKQFGAIVAVRFRSLPTTGMKVDEAGNSNLVKKVCAIKRQFSEVKDSMNAYG